MQLPKGKGGECAANAQLASCVRAFLFVHRFCAARAQFARNLSVVRDQRASGSRLPSARTPNLPAQFVSDYWRLSTCCHGVYGGKLFTLN